MNLMLLGALFWVSLLFFLRPPLRLLSLVTALCAFACLLLIGLISGVVRGQGSMVSAVALLAVSVVVLLERPSTDTRYSAPSSPRSRGKSSSKLPSAARLNSEQRAVSSSGPRTSLLSQIKLPARRLSLSKPAKGSSKLRVTKASKWTSASASSIQGGGAGGSAGNLSFEHYEVLDRIGVGGMGNVYRARRRTDGQTVALKVPQEKYLADAKFVKRFYREAEVLRRFDHPNIIKVYDYRSEGHEYYIAMEYIDGESLETLLEERPLNFTESVQVLRALADALRHIHAQNVVHRDIKPGNVMVLRGALKDGKLQEGGIKLMDFGIAVGKVLTRLTMTGARVGTPIYMAPEQAKGNRVDTRSDVYSLGLLAYEMITGVTAFRGSYDAVVHQQIFETPKPPKQVRLEVPGKLNDLVLAMIEKDPNLRPTLDEVIARIDEGVLSDEVFSDPVALLVSVQEKRGTLRLLDLRGKLRKSLRDVALGHLNAAPSALGSDAAGNLYFSVQESRPARGMPLIHKLSATGEQLLSFGPYGMGEQELLQPVSLAVGGDRLYVLDGETHYVSAYDLEGQFLFRFGGRGSGQGRFDRPKILVVTPAQQILVLDTGNREVQRFDREGRYLSRYAFRMDKSSGELRPLVGLSVDSQGTVYIVDGVANKVRKIEANDVAGNTFTLESLVGQPAEALWLLQVNAEGHIFVVCQGGHTLRVYSPVGDLLSSNDLYSPVQAVQLVHR